MKSRKSLRKSPRRSSRRSPAFHSSQLTPSKRKDYDKLDDLLKQYEGKKSLADRLTAERSDINQEREKVTQEEEKIDLALKNKLEGLKEGVKEGEEQIEELETELSDEKYDLKELDEEIEDIEKYLEGRGLESPKWRYVGEEEDNSAERDISDDYVEEKLSSPTYLVFIVIIIVGIIINLHLLYRLRGKDRHGNDISRDRKNMAAINGLGFAIILAIIFGGAIYLSRNGGYITNQGSALIILILISFLIVFLMGLLIGEYIAVGHIWTPIQPLEPPHVIIL